LNTITFTIGIAMSPPIEPGQFQVRDYTIDVSFPDHVQLPGGPVPLPPYLSSVFVVSWVDAQGITASQLRSNTYERHLPRHEALAAISELLLAFKLVRIGHADGTAVRTVGVDDTLFYWSQVDGVPSGDLNIRLKASRRAPWKSGSSEDPKITTELARKHIGTNTAPLARRYVRCFELLDHGFFSEAFVIAFSILDDFIQQTLHEQLERKGVLLKAERDSLLRGIKENRLRIYVGPLLRLLCGQDLKSMWPLSKPALDWLNTTRNRIAHAGENASYEDAARGIYVCLKTIVILRDHEVVDVEVTVPLFRHAKVTAAWTRDPPAWIPQGEVAESMDYRS
jgi:hypothetical protein